MLIKKSAEIPSSEITPKSDLFEPSQLYRWRSPLPEQPSGHRHRCFRDLVEPPPHRAEANAQIDGIQKSPFSTTEKQNSTYKDVSNYNNFYEFSTDKYEPADLAKNFKSASPGPSPSTARSRRSRCSTSTQSSRWLRPKNESTVIVASKAGRSLSPGLDFRSANSSSAVTQPLKQNM